MRMSVDKKISILEDLKFFLDALFGIVLYQTIWSGYGVWLFFLVFALGIFFHFGMKNLLNLLIDKISEEVEQDEIWCENQPVIVDFGEYSMIGFLGFKENSYVLYSAHRGDNFYNEIIRFGSEDFVKIASLTTYSDADAEELEKEEKLVGRLPSAQKILDDSVNYEEAECNENADCKVSHLTQILEKEK